MNEVNEQLQNGEWKGHTWETIQLEPFELSVATEVKDDPGVSIFQTIIPQAINKITELLPPSKHTKKVKVALFPSSSYRRDLSLTDSIPDWVKVCTRDQKTCYDISVTHTQRMG